ncbi:MAG TPA: hypothetical protein VLI69_03685 [Gammaproteobacteria bacterium]|nr:hypothetical protein [Gammaproteobacteria bacterium]
MNNINLLPWRQIKAQRERERLRLLIVLSAIFLFIFILAHVFLSKLNLASHLEISTLENKFFLSPEKNFNPMEMEIGSEYINQVKFSKKHIDGLLNFMNCLGQNHISVSHLYFQENQTEIIGRIKSTFILLKSIEMCRIKQYGFSTKILTFSHLRQSDFLQFNLIIS